MVLFVNSLKIKIQIVRLEKYFGHNVGAGKQNESDIVYLGKLFNPLLITNTKENNPFRDCFLR